MDRGAPLLAKEARSGTPKIISGKQNLGLKPKVKTRLTGLGGMQEILILATDARNQEREHQISEAKAEIQGQSPKKTI